MTAIELFPCVDTRSHVEITAEPGRITVYHVAVVTPQGRRIPIWSGLWNDEAWQHARRGRFRYGLKEIRDLSGGGIV